jgi:ABC-type polysaccharide/polyol phosphate transport system ATPase subunit
MKPGVIRMKNVTLDYRLYHDRAVTLRDTMLNLFNRKTRMEHFRALNDVSVTIEQGESVAIIGSNGAGKSTTLKILAGIYKPTSGTAETSGRITSLLDLGVGFHPDLTGEENLMLNGALIGLGRNEIKKLVPGIADFAQLSRFMDTPVKYYSNGMFMRLGFSLATAVDPDILLVDEVLAVGDVGFQERCYERIWDFRQKGRTLIFVSHDLDAVSNLCKRAVWLHEGIVRMDGDAEEVLAAYLQQESGKCANSSLSASPKEWGSREVWFDSVILRNEDGSPSSTFYRNEKIVVDTTLKSRSPSGVENVVFGFSVHRPGGETIIGSNNLEMNQPLLAFKGSTRSVITISLDIEEPGTYLLGLALTDPEAHKDYHWQEFFYPVTLLEERKEPPLRLAGAVWAQE